MQPKNINKTLNEISVARVSSYRTMFQHYDDHQIYGVYCWNEAVSAVFFRVISNVEVVLRNKFHEALSLHDSNGKSRSTDWYNRISLPPKSASKIRHATHKSKKGKWIPITPVPSPNDVVSRMSFGFWPKLLDIKLPWHQYLPTMLPGHRLRLSNQWSSNRSKDAFYGRLDKVNKIRNRIAHFEPLWKQGPLMEERKERSGLPQPRELQPAPSTPADCVARLALLKEHTCELLRWLSVERHSDLIGSYVNTHLNWLCTMKALDTYANLQPGITLPVSKFSRELNMLLKQNRKVSVTRNNENAGTFYPSI